MRRPVVVAPVVALVVALAAVAVLVAGCSGDRTAGSAPTTAPPASPPSAGVSAGVSAAFGDVVQDPRARLNDAYVERRGPTLSVSTYWICPVDRCGRQQVIASSRDGFVTADHVPVTTRTYAERMLPPRPRDLRRWSGCADVVGGLDLCTVPRARVRWTADGGVTWDRQRLDLGHLLTSAVPSLRRGVLAVVGGGDGATLLPFERVVRSTDAGRTWRSFDIGRTDGERPYTSGQVVTSDGRLLALLDHWSGDRPGRPGERVHGVHTSAGGDWSSYAPLGPTFSPPLVPEPDGWSPLVSLRASTRPDPVIWVTTWDDRLYVSTDDGSRFREIPAR